MTETLVRGRRLFFAASVLILLTDVIFVALNYRWARDALDESLRAEGQKLIRTVQVAMDVTHAEMLRMATFISKLPEIRRLFLEGKQAIEAEGGGAGGPRAAEVRRRLLAQVQPAWQVLVRDTDARQLHFHLPPGDLSFLRVHQPDRYGDRMDGLRHIIEDTHRERTARSGFETGRIYSGMRGVVPVLATPEAGRPAELIGALEVGTSLSSLLTLFAQNAPGEAAVLLSRNHVSESMWQEFVAAMFGDQDLPCQCVVEATSSPDVVALLRQARLSGSPDDHGFQLVDMPEGRKLAISFQPLRDYAGLMQPARPAVGRVLVWTDATPVWNAFVRSQMLSAAFALLAFLMVETLLVLAFRFATRRLQAEVSARTAQVESLLGHMEALARQDGLTGLPNRRYLMERLDQEIHRSGRSGTPLSLIMLDVDHFKAVNDTHGHLTGDEVLIMLADLVRQHLRNSDVCGRYGGEEFCVVLPDTPLEGARLLADRLRVEVASRTLRDLDGKSLSVTVSLGVAQMAWGQTRTELLDQADQALYQAKQAGRNRVVVADSIVAG